MLKEILTYLPTILLIILAVWCKSIADKIAHFKKSKWSKHKLWHQNGEYLKVFGFKTGYKKDFWHYANSGMQFSFLLAACINCKAPYSYIIFIIGSFVTTLGFNFFYNKK
jgi:hypothetical protein